MGSALPLQMGAAELHLLSHEHQGTMLNPTSLENKKVMPRRGKKAECDSGAKP